MQEMEQRVNVQLVEQHPHYYQGATISEIEDSEATGSTAVASMASVNAAAATASAPTVVRASGKQEQAFTSPGISSSSVSALASASVAASASAQVQQFHPQAVQASPVLVLHDDQRHRLRQKALVDSVESKV